MSTLNCYFPILLITKDGDAETLPKLLLKMNTNQAAFAALQPFVFAKQCAELVRIRSLQLLSRCDIKPIDSYSAYLKVLPPDLCGEFTSLVIAGGPDNIRMFSVDISNENLRQPGCRTGV